MLMEELAGGKSRTIKKKLAGDSDPLITRDSKMILSFSLKCPHWFVAGIENMYFCRAQE